MATSMRDLTVYERPNWTIPNQPPEAPPRSTAIVPSTRPNWTIPPAQTGPVPSMRDVSGAVDATPAKPAPTGPAENWKNAWRSMRAGGTVSMAAKAGLPMAAGAAVGTMQRMADDAAPAPEPFVPAAAKPGDIPIDPSIQAPKAVPARPLGFGPDNELTRNLANTINAVSGLGRGVGTGMGAVSRFMQEGSAAAGGAAKAGAAVQTAAPFVQGAQAANSMRSLPNLTVPPVGADPSIGPPQLPARRDGVIYRDGNSYSGANVAFGAEIDGARNPSAGVTSLPAGPTMRGGYELPRSVTTGDGGSTVGMGPIGFRDDRTGGTANFGPSLSVLGPTGTQRPRDIRAANALANERAIASERIAADRANASMREGGEMARANLTAGVQREGNAAQIAATMRGQDITREGNMISSAGNRMRLQYDMTKDQRDYATGRADKALEQRSARETQLQKNLEAFNTTVDADGKPQVNARAVAEMRQGIDRAVARMGIAGPHELGPQAEQQLIAASSLLKTMQENAGYLPWKPDKLKTIDPYDLTGLKVLPNGDRQITRPGQALGQIIPARFFRTEEGARFFGGTPTNRYDILGSN